MAFALIRFIILSENNTVTYKSKCFALKGLIIISIDNVP